MAYRADVKNDLRNLVTAEEAYFSRAVTYSSNLDTIGWSPTPGVSIEMTEVKGAGWRAVGRHRGAAGACWIWVGTVTVKTDSTGTTIAEGEPACRMGEK